MSPSLEVSLTIDGVPTVGDSITMCVMVTNQSSSPRVLMEHLNAQLKEYNSSPQGTFWKTRKKLYMQPGEGEKPCSSFNTKAFMIHRQCEYAQSLALLLDYLYLYILFNSVSFLVKFTLLPWSQLYHCLINETLEQTLGIICKFCLICFFHVHFSTSFTFSAVLTLHHTIPPSEYESVLAGDDIANVAVVIKDVRTKERVLAAKEFNISSPQITIEVQQHPASLVHDSQSITR